MTRSRFLTAAAAAILMTTISPMAHAQECIGFEGNFWSGNCLVDPGKTYAKAYDIQNMMWKGKPHIAIDMGDEIQFFDVSNANSPAPTGWTTFLMPLSGDAEHIMYQFSVGDDVRYAFSVHRAGVGIADLGTNGSPVPGMEQKWLRDYANPGADELNYDDNNIGGLVFDFQGRDFLLTHVFDDACNGAATLYEMTGSITLTSLGCVNLPTGALGVQGGRKAGNYLYVAVNKSITNPDPKNVAIFEIQDVGGNPNLVQRAENLFRADVLRKSSFDIDSAAGLIASADTSDNTVTIWSAGYGGLGGSLGGPTPVASISVPPDRTVWPNLNGPRSLALAWPLLWVDGGGLYDVKNPSAPEILIPVTEYFHQTVEGPQNPTDTFNCLDRNTIGGAFHPGGGSLYLPRFPIAQVYDTSLCTGPVQPLADLTVAPDPVFPGEPVTVTETGAGTVEQRAIWITLGSDPDATPVAGSQTPSSATPDTLNWTVPAGVTLAQEYWAHVAVGNVDYPYVSPTSTPQQYATQQITLDRTPEAQIALDPVAPITGDTVAVQVTAEGEPGTDTGAPPFELVVTDPTGTETTDLWSVGQNPPSVLLDISGTWTFSATVNYRHEAEGGLGGVNDPDQDGDHEAVDGFELVISSVSADFTITGTGNPPLHNESITLTSTSNAAAGAVLTYAWEVNDLSGIPQFTCSTNPCVIPAESLQPGTYDFELTLTNTSPDPDDVSVKVIRQEVADGSVNLELSSPQASSNPEIGELVSFSISGVPDVNDVSQVVWNFGGTSCDPLEMPQTFTCTPGGAITPALCLNGAYQYASGGTKNVQATVTIAGVQWPVSTTITIASTGSCSVAPPPPTCSYTLLPSSLSLDATGGSNGFQVSASSSTCGWTASTGYSWINLTTTSGTGTGYVYFTVAENATGTSRTGTISAAGRTFTINQSATGLCTATVTPAGGVTLGPAAGSSAQFQITIPSGCDWTARSLEGWLQVSPTAGTGNGVVTVVADANTYASDRTGEVEIAGSEYSVTQYPVLPADYEATNLTPDIGEWVTFTTDPRLEIQSWNFYDDSPTGQPSLGSRFNCRGEGPVVNCDVVGQAACRTITWNFPDNGPRYVTLRLKNGDTRTRRISVQDVGECPCEIEPPETSFAMSSNPVYAREEVTFTDTTPGAPTAKLAATMTATPTDPIIGQTVDFYLDARSADRVEWNFGATGCGGAPATATTTGPFSYGTEFRYAAAGTYTARATAYTGTTQIATGQVQVTVQNTGSCDGGGGGGTTCSYSLSPNSLVFDEDGGNGQFNVTTQTGCTWTATESLSWVRFTGGSQSGTGSGTVTYAVDPNTGAERSGTIAVQGRNHAITQLAATVGPEPGPPETWDWRVTKGTEVFAEATGRVFVWEPKEEGSYTVELTTSNCGGSTTATQTLEVLPPLIPPVTKLVVPSAVRAQGLNNTTWKTDLRLFNPCDGPVDVSVKFQPEGQNNAGAVLPGFEASLGVQGARAYRDVIQAIPSLANLEAKGSLLIEWDAPEDCRPLAISKTYNETAFGTFGQFVPALAARAPLEDELILTGLIEDDGHRTNLGFANFGDEDVVLAITLFSQNGDQIGNPVYPTVPALSTMQVVRVANAAGLTQGVSDFSVKVETFGFPVKGYASVIDNDTGDPVYVLPLEEQNTRVVLPGLAHLTGLNESEWRSDVALYNAHTQPVACRIDYYADEDLGQHYFLEFLSMPPGAEYVSEDFLGFLLGDRESKGYMTLSCEDGAPAPIVAARTYNRAPDGGTYGQNLVAFGEPDLIGVGERAYIPGIIGSADPDSGFRTNLGIVNTSETEWLGVNMWLYDASGNQIASSLDWAILPPGGFYQNNLFEPLGDVEGSLEIEVFAGGPAVIYASQVDNVTQDPIFMPAIPASTLEE